MRSITEVLREVLDRTTNAGAAADGVDLPEDLIEEAYEAVERLENLKFSAAKILEDR